MNLIEQLGGYEKAKLIVDVQINSEFQTEFFDINGNYYANDFGDLVIYKNNQWVDFDSKDPEFELFSITDLEAEVIQYRRQHKFYEVGDLVVKCGSIHQKSTSFSLWQVLLVLQTSIPCIEVAPLSKKGKVIHAGKSIQVLQQFRHAEPEEVKARKRLEVV
ncbi:hypothetical protein [Acinetobacter radioresistens]|uniref:hypothetical protein n=1 Tax=Acinetobacter radioresistens TaxID=40216 RepID=UPI0032124FD1